MTLYVIKIENSHSANGNGPYSTRSIAHAQRIVTDLVKKKVKNLRLLDPTRRANTVTKATHALFRATPLDIGVPARYQIPGATDVVTVTRTE